MTKRSIPILAIAAFLGMLALQAVAAPRGTMPIGTYLAMFNPFPNESTHTGKADAAEGGVATALIGAGLIVVSRLRRR